MAGSAVNVASEGPLLVGTDIVDVAEVELAMQSFGARYLNRVFTEAEISYSLSGGRDGAQRLAARFAAKEAVLKVLRPGKDEAIPLRSIESVRTPGGWCEVALSGAALDAATRAGLGGFALSLSHEARYATAVVVAHRFEAAPRSPDRGGLTRRPRTRARKARKET